MADDDRLRELEEKYEGYNVYDNAGDKIGKVDDLFVNEQDREEYIGVKMGFFGLRSTLIPMDVVRVNERDRAIEVADSRDHVKEAPHFADDDDITPEFERRIRSHFGLEGEESSSDRGSYGRRPDTGAEGAAIGDDTTRGETLGANDMDDDREIDVEGSPSREPVGREEYGNREEYGGSGETGTAATGGMSDLETGDRGREEGAQTGVSPTDEAYREAYRQGFLDAQRAGAGGGGAGGEGQGASKYSGTSSAGSGAEELGDTEAYRSDSTGGQPSHGEPLDRGSSEQGGEDRERTRRSDEGVSEESGATRVWRRIRG